MAAIEDGIATVIDVLPSEIVSKIDFLILVLQSLGGLFLLFLIVSLI